ncbi:hypothetical protein D9758_010193 [Tetrapyrgos nigripes]|uniref:glutathione transferase n=1 Tax=Tetrapyrgos nigripes TaxID=182062 RepID=A0A8H5FUR8_9AGAR|nr:hypothetical protein D9758_010193 [Tetrapyrgos nigripes]
MVLKLYGGPTTTCTQRVATVLYEKKIPFELHFVDWTKGEYKAPAHLEKQPFGQVPYLDDDGFILFESRAICRYLDAKYPDHGPKLAPPSSDLKATALFEQGVSIEISNFDPFVSKAVAEAVLKPKFMNIPKDDAVFDELIKNIDTKLDGYERILAKQKYIAGDELTMVDLFHLPYGSLLAAAGSDLLTTKGPNVARWWKDITSRESWAAIGKGIPTGAVKFD